MWRKSDKYQVWILPDICPCGENMLNIKYDTDYKWYLSIWRKSDKYQVWHWSQIAKVLKPLSLSSPNLLLNLNRFEEKQLSQLNQCWWSAYQWSRAISKKQTELNASAIRGNRWLINSATNQPLLLLYSYSTELVRKTPIKSRVHILHCCVCLKSHQTQNAQIHVVELVSVAIGNHQTDARLMSLLSQHFQRCGNVLMRGQHWQLKLTNVTAGTFFGRVGTEIIIWL